MNMSSGNSKPAPTQQQ
jgi:hypothetical protein